MPLFSRDTRPEVGAILLDGYRRMTPPQKLRQVMDLSAASRQMAESRIRGQYPHASATEVKLRLASLVLGRETMVRVFSWDPDKEGW
jgi:hypothetical protein